MAIAKKSLGLPGDDGKHQLRVTGCEALADWLTDPVFTDGTARELPSMTLFVETGRLKVCFNDKAERLSGFLTLEGLELLAEQLSEALDANKVEWKASNRRKG